MNQDLAPGSCSSASARFHQIAPGPQFLEVCARLLIAAGAGHLPDLRDLAVVLPNQHIAPAFRRAIARAAGRPVWMPRLNTLTGLVRERLALIEKDSDAARQLRLFEALRAQSSFKSLGLWQMAGELGQLFDELTERAAPLPESLEAFTDQLARGYGAQITASLSQEARFVHMLWQADCQGVPSQAMALQTALAQWADAAGGAPVFVMCDGALSATERRFIERLALKTEVHVFLPDRAIEGDALLATLSAAWPRGEDAPIAARAARLSQSHPGFSLRPRVQFMATSSLEQEAAAVARHIREALEAGAESVALIAADRVAARRARSALAAEGIEVEDETGWLLSTTRAAAFVDALLEVVASDGYHRALLDLCKSPFVFHDWEIARRDEAVLALERLMARFDFVSGLVGLERLAGRASSADVAPLVARINAMKAALPTRRLTIGEWIGALGAAIEVLGARSALEADAAGKSVLALLDARALELARFGARLDFGEWREWLNRELERAMFCDDSISSEVVITHLAAARLRCFDCVVVVGADRAHLTSATGPAIFANERLRAELGLATRAETRERLREDLSLLIAGAGRVLFTRQAREGDEINLPLPELEVLDLLHALAFGEGLEVPAVQEPVRGDAGGVCAALPPAPAVEAALVPGEISASGYASLVACPYQFFARHVLRLGEFDEVVETLEKRDYGERIHSILNDFHRDHPQLAAHDPAALSARLGQMSEAAFEADCRDNFLERAWLVRWLARVPAYVEWAREREGAGWLWRDGEVEARRAVALPDGGELTLKGRIDRVDTRQAEVALLDYKTQSAETLRKKVGDQDADVQLAFYSLLHDGAVAEAAYVALDDDAVEAVALAEVGRAGALHRARLQDSFTAMRAGAPLPAHGVLEDCARCEMQGVCRRHFHGDAS